MNQTKTPTFMKEYTRTGNFSLFLSLSLSLSFLFPPPPPAPPVDKMLHLSGPHFQAVVVPSKVG